MGDIADDYIDEIIFGATDSLVERSYSTSSNSDITYWTTSDGRKISYCDLEEKHARNILAMIRRKGLIPNHRLIDRINEFDMKNKEGWLF
jgi:hypothetical protein